MWMVLVVWKDVMKKDTRIRIYGGGQFGRCWGQIDKR